jgi:hypothetical protein
MHNKSREVPSISTMDELEEVGHTNELGWSGTMDEVEKD